MRIFSKFERSDQCELQGNPRTQLRQMIARAEVPSYLALPEGSRAVADFSDTVQQLIYDLLMLKVASKMWRSHSVGPFQGRILEAFSRAWHQLALSDGPPLTHSMQIRAIDRYCEEPCKVD